VVINSICVNLYCPRWNKSCKFAYLTNSLNAVPFAQTYYTLSKNFFVCQSWGYTKNYIKTTSVKELYSWFKDFVQWLQWTLVSWIYLEARKERLENGADGRTIPNKNIQLKPLGIPVTDTPTVTAQILYRVLYILVYDRMTSDRFARQEEATVTRKRTTTIATHTAWNIKITFH
jgi:hypothetical protein